MPAQTPPVADAPDSAQVPDSVPANDRPTPGGDKPDLPPQAGGKPSHGLADWLAQGYSWEHKLPDVVADPAHGLAGAGYSKASLKQKRDDLTQVEARCIVSMTQRRFLDRVLDIMP